MRVGNEVSPPPGASKESPVCLGRHSCAAIFLNETKVVAVLFFERDIKKKHILVSLRCRVGKK